MYTSILSRYQQGGQQNPQMQLMQMIAQLLQQGQDPKQVLQMLVSKGVPQEEAMQVVQSVMQQMQQGQEEQSQMMSGGFKRLRYQQGGQMQQAPQQINPQQIMQIVVQMLQQGVQPEQIIQQLVQMGISQEQAVQIIQQVMQQMQGQEQQEGEQGMEQNIQEEQMETPQMRRGGFKPMRKKYQEGGETLYSYLQNSQFDNTANYGNNRKALAAAMGIKNYTGTAKQNIALLNMLKGNTLGRTLMDVATSMNQTQEVPVQSFKSLAPKTKQKKLTDAATVNSQSPTTQPTSSLNEFLSSLPSYSTKVPERTTIGGKKTKTSWINRQSNMDEAGKTVLSYNPNKDNPIWGLVDAALTYGLERPAAAVARTFSGNARGAGDYIQTALSFLPIANSLFKYFKPQYFPAAKALEGARNFVPKVKQLNTPATKFLEPVYNERGFVSPTLGKVNSQMVQTTSSKLKEIAVNQAIREAEILAEQIAYRNAQKAAFNKLPKKVVTIAKKLAKAEKEYKKGGMINPYYF